MICMFLAKKAWKLTMVILDMILLKIYNYTWKL